MTESVWDYPRPPALVPCEPRVRIELGGAVIADSTSALRVLETSHPPTIYVPPDDVAMEQLHAAAGGSLCEWKGASLLGCRGRRTTGGARGVELPRPGRPLRRAARPPVLLPEPDGRMLAR